MSLRGDENKKILYDVEYSRNGTKMILKMKNGEGACRRFTDFYYAEGVFTISKTQASPDILVPPVQDGFVGDLNALKMHPKA